LVSIVTKTHGAAPGWGNGAPARREHKRDARRSRAGLPRQSKPVNGFCKEVFRELPMEFAVEAQKLLGISLEGSVG
jgi:hypothetical protein